MIIFVISNIWIFCAVFKLNIFVKVQYVSLRFNDMHFYLTSESEKTIFSKIYSIKTKCFYV